MDYVKADDKFARDPLAGVHCQGRFHRISIEHLTLAVETVRSIAGAMPKEHSHSVYHIVMYLSGDNRFSLNGAKVKGARGVLVACPPGMPHDFSVVDAGSASYAELTFGMESEDGTQLLLPFPEMLSLLFCSPPLADFKEVREIGEVEINGLLEALKGLLNGLEAEDETLGRLAASEAIFRLFRILAGVYGRNAGSEDARLGKVRRSLEGSFERRLSLEGLARQAGVSRAHLCREFRRAYGKPPMEYLGEVRLKAAKSLLETSSLSCKEISARTGFPDPMFFSKTFKRATGMTPKAYRAFTSP